MCRTSPLSPLLSLASQQRPHTIDITAIPDGKEATLRFGVCTWVFGGAPLPQIAAELASMRYDGMELMGNLAAYTPAEVRDACERTGLSVLSLTPENEDLAHPDAAVRQKALDYYNRLIDFAHEIGCPIVSCHGAVGRVRALS